MRLPCYVEGCEKTSQARGLCKKHWVRWRRHGDPLRVKTHSEYIKTGPENGAYRHGCEKHPLYQIWHNMMKRCYNQSFEPDYSRYGGRGIRVCDSWHDVRNFIADMSPRPAAATLERINNDGEYSPKNCAWASRATQARNRRTTKLTAELAEWARQARKAGMPRHQIAAKLGVHLSTVKKIIARTIWA